MLSENKSLKQNTIINTALFLVLRENHQKNGSYTSKMTLKSASDDRRENINPTSSLDLYFPNKNIPSQKHIPIFIFQMRQILHGKFYYTTSCTINIIMVYMSSQIKFKTCKNQQIEDNNVGKSDKSLKIYELIIRLIPLLKTKDFIIPANHKFIIMSCNFIRIKICLPTLIKAIYNPTIGILKTHLLECSRKCQKS